MENFILILTTSSDHKAVYKTLREIHNGLPLLQETCCTMIRSLSYRMWSVSFSPTQANVIKCLSYWKRQGTLNIPHPLWQARDLTHSFKEEIPTEVYLLHIPMLLIPSPATSYYFFWNNYLKCGMVRLKSKVIFSLNPLTEPIYYMGQATALSTPKRSRKSQKETAEHEVSASA